MAKYYYNKYNANSSNSYARVFIGYQDLGISQSYTNGWTGWTLNSSTGIFSLTGSQESIYAFSNKTVYNVQSSNKSIMFDYNYKGTNNIIRENYEAKLTTTYSRGSLVQSNILAENGTYPANGRHSDGYWYVRGSIYYDPPTIPSSISIPTLIKGGESFTVSWGASSYQTGYRLERQLNGGNWVQIVQQAGTSYVDTVDKGTLTVNYRVMSYGSGGNSGYRTGTARNVINFPEIFENFNGVYTAYEGAWENVNGTWVEIDSVWENVNGVWVEL